jgi:hypothetical protein
MEIRHRAESLFNHFVSKGSLGEGAQRTEQVGFMDRAMVAAMPMAYDTMTQNDNVDGVDRDPRAGFVNYDANQIQQLMSAGPLAELEQAANELLGPTPVLTPQQMAEAKEDIQNMVEAGIFTQAEADAMFAPGAAPADLTTSAPHQETYAGSLEKTDSGYRGSIETSGGDTHDVECFLSDSRGQYFLSVVDQGDHATAQALFMGNDGSEFQEQMIVR